MNRDKTAIDAEQHQRIRQRLPGLLGTRIERETTNALILAGPYHESRTLRRAASAAANKRADCQRREKRTAVARERKRRGWTRRIIELIRRACGTPMGRRVFA